MLICHATSLTIAIVSGNNFIVFPHNRAFGFTPMICHSQFPVQLSEFFPFITEELQNDGVFQDKISEDEISESEVQNAEATFRGLKATFIDQFENEDTSSEI